LTIQPWWRAAGEATQRAENGISSFDAPRGKSGDIYELISHSRVNQGRIYDPSVRLSKRRAALAPSLFFAEIERRKKRSNPIDRIVFGQLVRRLSTA